MSAVTPVYYNQLRRKEWISCPSTNQIPSITQLLELPEPLNWPLPGSLRS